MAGKTKAILLEERLKEKEIIYKAEETKTLIQNTDIEKLRVLREVMETTTVTTNDTGTVFFESALNDKAKEIIARKIIEITRKL